MNSQELARYIEATDRIAKPWLLVQLRLQKLQERRDRISPDLYWISASGGGESRMRCFRVQPPLAAIARTAKLKHILIAARSRLPLERQLTRDIRAIGDRPDAQVFRDRAYDPPPF